MLAHSLWLECAIEDGFDGRRDHGKISERISIAQKLARLEK
jgi:hypothetical protein